MAKVYAFRWPVLKWPVTAAPLTLVGAILAGVMFVSCESRSPLAPSEAGITNVLWKLQSLQRTDSSEIGIQNPERFTVRLEETGGVYIRADCNSCGGSYRLIDRDFQLGVLGCTKAFCGSHSLDTEYLRALRSARVSVVRGLLRMDTADAVLVFAW